MAFDRKAAYKKNAAAWRKRQLLLDPWLDVRKHLKDDFDLTLEAYQQMFFEQNGCCAICKEPETLKIKGKIVRLAVDHCHKTGRNRRLLCSRCNLLLGKAKDSIVLLEAVVAYLKEWA